MLREEWPSRPYRPAGRRKVVALVNGAVDSGATALARQLAVELGVPLIFRDGLRGCGPDAWWTLLADSPVGGVLLGRFGPEEARPVADGLRRAGVNPASVPEIICFPAWGSVPDRPLGLGPALVAAEDESGYPDDRASLADVVRLALQVNALSPASET
jgi:hypothetical protein